MDEQRTEPLIPPREQLVRALYPAIELRAAESDDDDAPADGRLATLEGHFAVFNDWTEIDSVWEGRFLESIAPGTFAKTFAEGRDQMRVTFQHGKDPQLGDKPIGPIEDLEEDGKGAFYTVPMLDTSYNRDLLPGLKAGLYGSSFRFRVLKDDWNQKPRKTVRNPDQLPERIIREAQVFEFGPVTYPAYQSATAGARSLTDEYILSSFLREPQRLRDLLSDGSLALPDGAELAAHSDVEGSRVSTPPRPIPTREEFIEWLSTSST